MSGSLISNKSSISNKPVGASVGLGTGSSAITNQPVGKLLGNTGNSSLTNQPVGATVGLGTNGSAITNQPIGSRLFPPSAPTSQVGAPQITGSPDDNVATAGRAVAPAVPATPVTPISQGAFKSQLASYIASNPLNAYYNPTYHFQLFMTGDKDLLSQQGESKSINDLLTKVNGSNQIGKVIIAETGVTGFNIRDVEIETVNAQTGMTRQQKGTQVTMTIVEPLGVSFLDGMSGAGQLLGVWDYTKMVYYLQLWFEGYNEAGVPVVPIPNPPFAQPASNSQTRNNGGHWLWALKLNTVDAKVNEDGGVYTLHFIIVESVPMFVESMEFAPKAMITVSGSTVEELLNAYADKLSLDSQTQQGVDGQKKGLLTFKIDSSHPIPFGLKKTKTPGQFILQPSAPNHSSVKILQKGNVYSMTVNQGTHLNDVIHSVVLSTEEGQAMYKNEPVSQSDQTANQYRTPVLISVEPDIKFVKYDKGPTRNYQCIVTAHLTPFYTQGPVLDTVDLTNRDNQSAQRQRILEMAQLGFIRKQYDYVFTGLNTEVIDFDIKFNFAWQAVLAKQEGAQSTFLTEQVQGKTNDHVDNQTPPLQTTDLNDPSSTNTVYIEDILPQLNSNVQIGKILPISFTTSLYDTKREEGIGSNLQFHAAAPMASSIVSQQYYGAFMQIDINVRGDPYWLGQTNLERQVILRNGGSSFDPNGLPDFSAGNPTFVLNIKFPVQIGDNFAPKLMDSSAFNGLFEVIKVKHSFSEGSFKQVLTANRLTQVDPSLAFMADTNATNSDASSSSGVQNPSGAAGTPTAGQTPGTSFNTPSLIPTTGGIGQVTPTALQSGDTTTIGNLSSDQVASLKAAIGQSESGNNPSQGNNGLGYIGQYQFGQAALISTGYVMSGSGNAKDPSTWTWTGQNGVNSISDFLGNPNAQNSAMNDLMAQNYNTMLHNGTISSSTSSNQVSGLLSAAQLAGAGGATAFAQGRANPSDPFGSSTQKYYNLGYHAIRV